MPVKHKSAPKAITSGWTKKRLVFFLHVANIILHNARAQFTNKRKPWNLDDFALVSRRILQTGPWSLAEFSAENCGPY